MNTKRYACPQRISPRNHSPQNTGKRRQSHGCRAANSPTTIPLRSSKATILGMGVSPKFQYCLVCTAISSLVMVLSTTKSVRFNGLNFTFADKTAWILARYFALICYTAKSFLHEHNARKYVFPRAETGSVSTKETERICDDYYKVKVLIPPSSAAQIIYEAAFVKPPIGIC